MNENLLEITWGILILGAFIAVQFAIAAVVRAWRRRRLRNGIRAAGDRALKFHSEITEQSQELRAALMGTDPADDGYAAIPSVWPVPYGSRPDESQRPVTKSELDQLAERVEMLERVEMSGGLVPNYLTHESIDTSTPDD